MTVEQIIQQGGLVAVCGMLIYLLREQGKKLADSNATWLQLGQIVERLTGSVERMEHRLDRAAVCPVTGATSEVLADAARQAGGTVQHQVQTIVREQIRRFADASERDREAGGA